MSNAQGIRAGNAYVEITGDTRGLERAIDSITDRLAPLQRRVSPISAAFDRLGNRITGIGRTTTAVGGAILGASAVITGAIGAATRSFTSAGSAIADFSARTGVGAVAASTYAYATGQVGAELTEVEGAIKKNAGRLSQRQRCIRTAGIVC